MKSTITIAAFSLAAFTAFLITRTTSHPSMTAGAHIDVDSPRQGPSTSNCLAPPRVSFTVPKDMALTRQADANCFAWQEFLALNWVASKTMRGAPDKAVPASAFGTPNDRRPVVWETYKESDEVFLPNGRKPAPWNSWAAGSSIKVLGGMLSEVDPEPPLDLSDIGQASHGHPWLTAQNKYLTLYERRLNQDEFNYIFTNQLYIASKQGSFVQSPGLNLPDGTPATAQYGPLGAIETKAAWIELDDPKDWPRYKTAKAVVMYPKSKPKTVVVGLVGLHIIHKTALGQQFIWATFEHIENCPDKDQVANKKLAPRYTYYNPNCNPQTDYYKCVENANPTTAGSPPNPYGAPIQVVRQTPISSRANDNVTGLNEAVWNVISNANPQSVFLNYQLVNTLWSNQSTPIGAGARTPLFAGQLSPGPSQEPVANTTLETYVQNLTCLACHASAPIATAKPAATTKIFDPAKAGTAGTALNPYASDYSFLFNNAGDPKAGKGNH
jgi:hypothetical protein